MSNNRNLVSIVIPVYNAEKYIEQCVNSIVDQTYKEIELILVNNGSTDNSAEVCQKLSETDKRIQLIHLDKNILASGARNTGVDHASGDWLIFMDSDDFWDDKDGLKKLINYLPEIKYEYDFLIFNYKRFFQKDNLYVDRPDFSDKLINTVDKKEKIDLLLKNSFIPAPCWGKLIKLSFLKENDIKFITGTHAEDIPWFITLLEKSINFTLVNFRFHVYRKQVPGAGTYGFKPKTFNDLLNIVESESKRLKAENGNPLKDELLSFIAYEYSILMASSANFTGAEWKTQKEKLLQLKWLLNYDKIEKVKKVNTLTKIVPFRIACKILHLYAKKVVNRL